MTPRAILLTALTALAALALAALVLTSRAAPARGGLLVVTPGADVAAVRDLAERIAPRRVLAVDGAAPGAAADGAVASEAALAALALPGEPVHVVGAGLTAAGWQALGARPLAWTPAPAPVGIIRLDAPAALAPNVAGRLAGLARVGAGGGALRVTHPDGRIDSVATADTVLAFDVPVRAPAPGRFTWRLDVVPARGSAVAESLGVAVRAAPPLRVLLVEPAPAFEFNGLVAWLARRGAQVERRAALGPGRVRELAWNRPVRPLVPLGPALLDSLDVVVLAPGASGALAPAEQGALRRATREEGLGLVLLLDRADDAAARLAPVRAAQVDAADPRPIRVSLGARALPDAVVPPVRLAADSVLARDPAGRPVAVLARAGLGVVAVAAAVASEPWPRLDRLDDYAAWWTTLLESARRGDPALEQWSLAVPLPRAGHAVNVELLTRAAAPLERVLTHDTAADTLTFVRATSAEPHAAATWWPAAAGWWRTSAADLWIAPADAWRTLDAERRRAASTAALAATPPARDLPPRGALRWPWFLLLLGSVGMLWWGERGRRGVT